MARLRPFVWIALAAALLIAVVLPLVIEKTGDDNPAADVGISFQGFTNSGAQRCALLKVTNKGRGQLHMWGPVGMEFNTESPLHLDGAVSFPTNVLDPRAAVTVLVEVPREIQRKVPGAAGGRALHPEDAEAQSGTAENVSVPANAKWRAFWMVQRLDSADKIAYGLHRVGVKWLPLDQSIDLSEVMTDWYPQEPSNVELPSTQPQRITNDDKIR